MLLGGGYICVPDPCTYKSITLLIGLVQSLKWGKKHVPGFSKAKLFGKKLKPFLSAVASSMKVMGEPGWEGPAGGLRSPGLGKSLSEEEEVFG